MTTRKSPPKRSGPAKGQGRDRRAPEKRRTAPKGPKKTGAAPVAARLADEAADRGERIAKVMARAGLCSRRDAETWIENGRVQLNGTVLTTPAITVTPNDTVLVDGNPLPMRERTRLWLYHKPRGLVTTNKDPEGRPTVFDRLPDDLPRVLTVGRLDINTEGLLLLTNDGGLARVLELPATGWLRRYRVRAFGKVTQADLDGLNDGVAIDGVLYGAIEATLDKEQGGNVWMTVGLREGKNREVKRVLEHLGLAVNRLIRLSYGPFQLMDMPEGEVREIRGRVLRDQLGETLAEEAGADFDAPIFHAPKPESEKKSAGRPGDRKPGDRKSGDRTERGQGKWLSAREGRQETDRRRSNRGDRFERPDRSDRPERSDRFGRSDRPDRADRPGRADRPDRPGRPDRASRPERPERSERGERFGRDEGRPQSKRKNSGPRQEKVSPRSRFRLTSEPKPRKDYGEERFSPPPRRIWGEEGQLEDKQQQNRTDRDKGERRGPPKGGRGPRRGDRS